MDMCKGHDMRRLITTLAMTAVAALSAPASAAVVLSSNFDEIAIAPGSYVSLSTVSGWTAGTGAIEVQNNAAGAPHSASNLVELDSFGNSSMYYMLDAGSYDVSYWYSPRPNVASTSNGIELWIGNTLLDSITATGGSSTNWSNRTVSFATTGGALTFRAVGTSDSTGGYLDDITISTAAVPEPATWAMMILGFGLVGAGMRRRRTATQPAFA
jgi:hypothetical protein